VIPVPDLAERSCDALVIGAGAAGLMAALAARGVVGEDGAPLPVKEGAPRVVLLNNEARLGLKILVSGGGRCNVTNERVDERDYATDAPHVLRGLLRGFSSAAARAFFDRRGCPLYAEPLGKLFPTTDDARDALSALLGEVARAGVPLVAPAEVVALERVDAGWRALCGDGRAWTARRIVLATGGKSLPKTGSRGFGLDALARLGHAVEPPLPALTPLLLRDDGPLHGLQGLTLPAALTLAPKGAPPEQVAGARFRPLARAAGSLLVTHKGASGPAALDVSGACGRALARGEEVTLLLDAWSLHQPDGPWAPFRDLPKPPGASLPQDDAPRPPAREAWLAQARPLLADRERGLVNAIAERLPRSLAQALLRAAGFEPQEPIKRIDERGGLARLHLALTQADLRLAAVDGYAKAEVTAGGVLLGELDRSTLESKLHPGLHCCGEVVNVTGRLGGFNFQWAWSSGFAAGRGLARELSSR
jgi:predicted Rossmann fold flavoprotein